jgi:hypothetical protein
MTSCRAVRAAKKAGPKLPASERALVIRDLIGHGSVRQPRRISHRRCESSLLGPSVACYCPQAYEASILCPQDQQPSPLRAHPAL